MASEHYRRVLSIYQETSGDAWRSIEPHLAEVDALILTAIRDGYEGATSDEVERQTGLKHQTVSAQIRHMAEAGLLVDSGLKRPTRSGRNAIVWTMPSRRWQTPDGAQQVGLF